VAIIGDLMEVRLTGGYQSVTGESVNAHPASGRGISGEHDVGHGEAGTDHEHRLAGAESSWSQPGI
jgi:hypothetical protein